MRFIPSSLTFSFLNRSAPGNGTRDRNAAEAGTRTEIPPAAQQSSPRAPQAAETGTRRSGGRFNGVRAFLTKRNSSSPSGPMGAAASPHSAMRNDAVEGQGIPAQGSISPNVRSTRPERPKIVLTPAPVIEQESGAHPSAMPTTPGTTSSLGMLVTPGVPTGRPPHGQARSEGESHSSADASEEPSGSRNLLGLRPQDSRSPVENHPEFGPSSSRLRHQPSARSIYVTTQDASPPDSHGSHRGSTPRSFSPGTVGGWEGGMDPVGPQPFMTTSTKGSRSHQGLNQPPSRSTLGLRARVSSLLFPKTPITPATEAPPSPFVSRPLPDVPEASSRSPSPPELSLSEGEINDRVADFLKLYGSDIPKKQRASLDKAFRTLLKAYPDLHIDRTGMPAETLDSREQGADATSSSAPPAPEVFLTTTDVRIKINPADTTKKGIRPVVLAATQAKLLRWEKDHQPDHDSVRQAYFKVEQVKQLEREGKISAAQKAAAHNEAANLLRRGIGIDDETWEAAQADIRKMGRLDAADGLLHLAVTGGFVGVIGADVLPSGVSNSMKYVLAAVSNTFLNSFSQVALNSVQDHASGDNGVPVMAANIAASPRLMDLSSRIMAAERKARDLLAQDKPDRTTRAAVRSLTTQMKALDKELARYIEDYDMKMAHAGTFLKKYSRTLPFRVFYMMPLAISMVALSAKIPAAALIGYAVNWVNQLMLIYLAGFDEVTKNKHVIKSNAILGRYIETDEEGNPVLDKTGQIKVDVETIRSMWSNPVDKKQLEISLVYTSALADLYRQLNKAEKARNRFTGTGQKREDLEENIRTLWKKIDDLEQDIIHFTEGCDAIRTNKGGAEWGELEPDGIIAQMLSDPRKYIGWLTKARFDRPGEFLSELGDRVYGTSSLRMLGFGIQDAATAGDVLPTGTQAIAQTGGLLAITAATPTAKEYKPRARAEHLKGKVLPQPDGTIPRRALYGRRIATQGSFKPVRELPIKGRNEPMRVDMTTTKAWAEHTQSFAYRKSSALNIFATNVVKNSGEIVATPAAWYTAHRHYSSARKLRDEIAQRLKELEGNGEPQAAEDPSGTLLEELRKKCDGLRKDTQKTVNDMRKGIREHWELLEYHFGTAKADKFSLPRPEGVPRSATGMIASRNPMVLATVAELPEPTFEGNEHDSDEEPAPQLPAIKVGNIEFQPDDWSPAGDRPTSPFGPTGPDQQTTGESDAGPRSSAR